jgi:hypothetical protein
MADDRGIKILLTVWVVVFWAVVLASVRAPPEPIAPHNRTGCPPPFADGPLVVVFVPSAIARHKQRRIWLRHAHVAPMFFVIGVHAPAGAVRAVRIEAIQNGPEHYRFAECDDGALACKAYQALRHIASAYRSAPPRFVWRIADDQHLDLGTFRWVVAPGLQTCRLLLGRLRFPWHDRDSDLYLTKDLYSRLGLLKFGKHMHPMAYCMSWDVAQFIGTASIPPLVSGPEDVLVGHWLLFYDIDFVDVGQTPARITLPGEQTSAPLLVGTGSLRADS